MGTIGRLKIPIPRLHLACTGAMEIPTAHSFLRALQRWCLVLMLLCVGMEDFRRVHQVRVSHSHPDPQGTFHSQAELLRLVQDGSQNEPVPGKGDPNHHSHVVELTIEVPTIEPDIAILPPPPSGGRQLAEVPGDIRGPFRSRSRLLRPPCFA